MSDSDQNETQSISTETQSNKPESNNIHKGERRGLTGVLQTPGWKFIITGIITLLLTIPALLVWGLVEERADRARDVASSIAKGWGQPQRVNGPYLVIPYLKTEKQDKEFRTVKRYVLYSPKTLESENNLDVEERKRSIYTTQLYHVKSKLSGQFSEIDMDELRSEGRRPQLDQAFIAMEFSDLSGFRSEVSALINSQNVGVFLPGLDGMSMSRQLELNNQRYSASESRGLASGIHLPLDVENIEQGFEFEIALGFNGSRFFELVPSGQSTKVTMTSNWPHPGFDGRFLPEEREISEDGFSSTWSIPNLARGISAVNYSSGMVETSSVIRVSFVKPLDFYQLVSRTLKYAIGFFSMVFLAIFILEITGGRSVHWIQYILSGLAMVIFYMLLLALAEQIGFDFAYIIAAIATTLLIAWYVGQALDNKRGSYLLAGVIGITYMVMYLILKEDEYALLIGSIIAFSAIAMTMYATRKTDWNRLQNA